MSTYTERLIQQINDLEDGFSMKEVELCLLQNDMEETLSPFGLLSEQSGHLLEMFEEVVEFERKKPSERITASKKRLFTLIDINTRLGKIVSYNQSLKLINQQMVGSMQALRIENEKLRGEIKKLTNSTNF